MKKQDINVMQWASHLYSREVCGDIYEAEVQSGIPVEIPLNHMPPETLEQTISRLVRVYTADTGNEVESIDEANDFYIPGEDEDYEEDDYLPDMQEQGMISTLPASENQAAPVSSETGAEPPAKSDAPAATTRDESAPAQ